jgi:hypothetical protein
MLKLYLCAMPCTFGCRTGCTQRATTIKDTVQCLRVFSIIKKRKSSQGAEDSFYIAFKSLYLR